jgi:ferredoxin
VAPAVFDQRDSDGIVKLLDENPPAGLHDEIREAAHLCPALAITVESQRP